MKKPTNLPPQAMESQSSAASNKLPSAAPNVNKPSANLKNGSEKPTEYGGPKGLEPTRYGDWEKNGRCTDF